MTRDEILNEVYRNGLIQKITNSMKSKIKDMTEDFQEEMFLILCELPDDKLIGLYERHELEYYMYYIAKAQAFNNKSDFWTLYKGKINIDYNVDINSMDKDEN